MGHAIQANYTRNFNNSLYHGQSVWSLCINYLIILSIYHGQSSIIVKIVQLQVNRNTGVVLICFVFVYHAFVCLCMCMSACLSILFQWYKIVPLSWTSTYSFFVEQFYLYTRLISRLFITARNVSHQSRERRGVRPIQVCPVYVTIRQNMTTTWTRDAIWTASEGMIGSQLRRTTRQRYLAGNRTNGR